MKYILSLDQGTTSSRAIVFDAKGSVVSVAQKEFKQIFPNNGWVEHDASEIWSSQWTMMQEAICKLNITPSEINAIAITNQRETVIAWDKTTGNPIYNAIVWQDRRTADYCKQLVAEGKSDLIRQKTGLIVDSYFSATKIKWILDNVKGARDLAKKGDLLVGTVDTWLIWNLTEGKVHATDCSNASRTLLYNIKDQQWDEELLELFNIPKNILPEVKQSSEVYGYVSERLIPAKIPIAGVAGDQQAATFGQFCLKEGMAKNTYGTGCFTLMNIGKNINIKDDNLITTVAWGRKESVTYALEGSVFVGGAVIQWLRDGLQLIKKSSEVEDLALTVPDNGGVYFVPAFIGLGAPHWDSYARGSFFGLTRASNRGHIARAALESIALQSMDILDAMQKSSKVSLKELRVDGGASQNNLLMQYQADILNIKVVRPTVVETTALGAAYLAGLATGFWKSAEEINALWKIDKVFEPQISDEKRLEIQEVWHKAVDRTKNWIS